MSPPAPEAARRQLIAAEVLYVQAGILDERAGARLSTPSLPTSTCEKAVREAYASLVERGEEVFDDLRGQP